MLITLLRLGSERLLFSPEQTFTDCDLDSVRMSAFGQKQSFAYFGDPCILCGDGVRYDQKWLLPEPQPAAHFYELGLVEVTTVAEPNF